MGRDSFSPYLNGFRGSAATDKGITLSFSSLAPPLPTTTTKQAGAMDTNKVAASKGTTTDIGGANDGSSSSSNNRRNTLRDELQRDGGGLRICEEIDEELLSGGGGGSSTGGGGGSAAGRGGGRAPDDIPSMVTVTTVIFSVALGALVLPMTFTNPKRRTMYYVLLVCVAAVVSASSRGLTAFRRELVVGWVNGFHRLVAILLMAAVATYITTTWSGWCCLMLLFVNLGVVVTLNLSRVIGDYVRRMRLRFGWKNNNTEQLPYFIRSE